MNIQKSRQANKKMYIILVLNIKASYRLALSSCQSCLLDICKHCILFMSLSSASLTQKGLATSIPSVWFTISMVIFTCLSSATAGVPSFLFSINNLATSLTCQHIVICLLCTDSQTRRCLFDYHFHLSFPNLLHLVHVIWRPKP